MWGQTERWCGNTTVDGYYIDEDGRRTLVPLEEGDNPGQENSQYIFVGDSRTVGMQGAVGRDHVLYWKSGRRIPVAYHRSEKALKKALKAAPQAEGHSQSWREIWGISAIILHIISNCYCSIRRQNFIFFP